MRGKCEVESSYKRASHVLSHLTSLCWPGRSDWSSTPTFAAVFRKDMGNGGVQVDRAAKVASVKNRSGRRPRLILLAANDFHLLLLRRKKALLTSFPSDVLRAEGQRRMRRPARLEPISLCLPKRGGVDGRGPRAHLERSSTSTARRRGRRRGRQRRGGSLQSSILSLEAG